MRSLCCVAIVVCAAAFSVQDDTEWWKTTNFYQVYPRSFKDSDGDGIGDLKGVAQMASYFKEIGVDAIWLSPIQMSPMADFGYDISNFTAIDPIFGTMDDFKYLAQTLAALDVKLVVDFVPNHSSDQHPWFQKSLAKIDPYTDFYIWDDGKLVDGQRVPPNNWLSVFSGSAWEWYEGRQQYYYHAFLKQQPDLNFRNPLVVQKMEEVIRFWLDMGVDGFRLDSANYLLETANRSAEEPKLPGTDGSEWADYNHTYCTQNQNGTYELLESWAQIFYNYSVRPGGKPRSLFVEVYTDLYHTMKYYGHGNTSLMQPFNFMLLVHTDQSTRAPAIKTIIDDWMSNMPEGDVPNWVVGNHDNGRIADRYGREMIDVLAILTSFLPGIKVTYYGSEIGMQDTFVRWDQTVDPSGRHLGPDNYMKGSRDPERTPMQWDGSPSAGFSTNLTTWLPVNPNYWWLNVAEQRAAEASHMKIFQKMAELRKDPVLRKGGLQVEAPDNDTLIVVRSYSSGYYMLLVNMGSEMRTYNKASLPGVTIPDGNMEVVVCSINFDGYKIGDKVSGSSLNVSMRPKTAVILGTSPPTPSPSSAVGLVLSLPLLLAAILTAC